MELKKLKIFYYISQIGYLGAGIVFSLLLVIIARNADKDTLSETVSFIIAAVFWLCLLVGSVFITLAGMKERQIYRQIKESEKDDIYSRHLFFGAISFFKNKKGTIADVLFIASSIIIIVLYLMHINISWMIITLTMLVNTSFIFHSFWNGKIYICINYLKNESKNKE